MDTARYRAFLTSVETGSFSRAAERLNYTPSGVSQLVSALERELGVVLLRRNKRGVEATEDGLRLLPAARRLLLEENHVFELAAEINGLLVGSATIATYSSIATHWLPPVIGAFQRDYPNVKIQLMEGIRQEVVQWLEEKRVDMGFMSEQTSMPYDWVPLAEDPLLAILPKTHPLAGADAYPLERCAQDAFIMPALGRDEDLMGVFAQRNIIPNVRFTTLENFSALTMVEQGLGVSVMNELITRRFACDVVKLPLSPPVEITLGVAVPSLPGTSPVGKRFLQYAVERLTRRETRVSPSVGRERTI